MNKKKVAIISARFPPSPLGGISSAHYNIFLHFKKNNYDTIGCNYGDNIKLNKSENKQENIYRFSTPAFLKLIIKFIFKIYFKIKDNGKLSYQAFNIVSNCIGSFKINFAIVKHKPDIIILPDQGCPGLFIKRPKYSKMVLISHHNPVRFLDNPLLRDHSKNDANLAIKLENYALKKIDMVLCPSQYMFDLFNKTYSFSGELAVIPNLIDIDYIKSIVSNNIRKKLSLPNNSIVVYIPSAGSRIKGTKYVFEIIRRIAANSKNKIGFYLSGNLNDEITYELKYLPSNVSIYAPGSIPYDDNIAIIKSCSFSVTPTLLESFGMAILEAVVCGLPVVSFDVGGVGEIIKNGYNGFLSRYMDVENLIWNSVALLNNDTLKRLKNNCYKYIKSQYNPDDIFKILLQKLNLT